MQVMELEAKQTRAPHSGRLRIRGSARKGSTPAGPSRLQPAASLTSRASLHPEALRVWSGWWDGQALPALTAGVLCQHGLVSAAGPGKWKTNPHRSAAHIHPHSARPARVVDGSARDAGQRFAVVPGGGSGSAGPGPPRRSRRRRLVGCVCVGCVGARRRLFSRRSRSTSRQQSPLVAFRPRRQFRTAPPLPPPRRAPVPAGRPPRRPRPRPQHQQQPGHPRQ